MVTNLTAKALGQRIRQLRTRKGLTLQGGVRYDYYLMNYPESKIGGPGYTASAQPEIVYPSRSTQQVKWHDITPRVGVGYDVFGNGKTAVKFNSGTWRNDPGDSLRANFVVNNAYIAEGTMTFGYLDGWWTDAGTFESLHRASCAVAKDGANHLELAAIATVAHSKKAAAAPASR